MDLALAKCEHCGETDGRVLLKHHISYNPEITQVICWNCHYLVHKHKGKLEKIEKDLSFFGIIAGLNEREEYLRKLIAEKRRKIKSYEHLDKAFDMRIKWFKTVVISKWRKVRKINGFVRTVRLEDFGLETKG